MEIDTISFSFEVICGEDCEEKVKTAPEDGGYVHGLFMEGANWDSRKHHIIESSLKVLFNTMPTIWLKPIQEKVVDPNARADVGQTMKYYECPVYKTSARAGQLTTTGHSTNYVLSILLPIRMEEVEEKWIKRGVAMLCQLDD